MVPLLPTLRNILHFNSIKVRLELTDANGKVTLISYFNSIKVRLEHSMLTMLLRSLRNFNSIKVRLEQKYKSDYRAILSISIP